MSTALLDRAHIAERTLCRCCGLRYGLHKAGTDTYGPEGRCPADRDFPRSRADEGFEMYWERVREFWAVRSTVFKVAS